MAKNTRREQHRIERERKQRRRNMIIFGLLAILLVFAALVVYLTIDRPRRAAANATATAAAVQATIQAASANVTPVAVGTPSTAPVITTDTGLQYQDMVVGTGAEAITGSTVSVHYTGWLMDGTEFDSSRSSGQPITVQIGAGGVIDGWEEGLVGMKVGGVRKLVIPPDLGYGAAGRGSIPGNATLVFEVELLSVE